MSDPAGMAEASIESDELRTERIAGAVHRPLPAFVATQWFADACLLATTLIWGVNLLVFKYSIGILEPVVFNALRLVFASIALGVCLYAESRFRRKPMFPRSRPGRPVPWKLVFWFSLLTGIVYMVLFLSGISRTTAGNTALLLASMPMWTAILSFIFLRERLRRVSWAGLAITFSGTAIVTLSGGGLSLSAQHLLGNVLVVAGAFSWAAATVISRPILRVMSPLQLTFIASLTTTPFHLMWIAADLDDHLSTILTPWMLVAIVFSGAFSTGLAYVLWNTGVKILGGSHAAIFQNVVTVVAVVGGWIILGEQPLMAQIAGGITIVAGVLLMRRGRNRE
jgi:drug/metabolite transporter (DMT)-like permease